MLNERVRAEKNKLFIFAFHFPTYPTRLTDEGSLLVSIYSTNSKQGGRLRKYRQPRQKNGKKEKKIHMRNWLKMNNSKLCITRGSWDPCPLEVEIVLTSTCSSVTYTSRDLIFYGPLCTGAPASSSAVSTVPHQSRY